MLRVEEVETPQPGEGEVLLRVKAAGINPIDWKVLHGGLAGGEPLAEPRGLGVDVAGVVEKVGPGVEGLSPGEDVLGNSSTAAYAEYALSRPQMLQPKPPGLVWEVAGSLGVVVGTAYATLEELKLGTGETLLVLGASGAVGSIATQLAVARGVRVVGTAGPAKLEQVSALGATPVAYGDGLLERLREAAPEGVDAVLDTSGHGEISAAVELKGNAERVLDDRLLRAGERPRGAVPRRRRRRAHRPGAAGGDPSDRRRPHQLPDRRRVRPRPGTRRPP